MSQIEAETQTDVFQREIDLCQDFQYNQTLKKEKKIISLNVSSGKITVFVYMSNRSDWVKDRVLKI